MGEMALGLAQSIFSEWKPVCETVSFHVSAHGVIVFEYVLVCLVTHEFQCVYQEGCV